MIKALFGANSTSATLKQGLDDTMGAHQAIANRVARALETSSQTSDEGVDVANATDLTEDMAALADAEIRYEGEARLLSLFYDKIRSAIRAR
ncbi:MAG: hypothetical protein HKN21_05960 [Candidatus Eisenbacteria bacterium]|uniref:Uncharacterized protein n=1 Tax=Eiseniibacteriota bacterium TaxID=2212470 RepID=A0A7Y2E6T6_UNCEI|nr:hypothetical protein [Candidatus Eisenbacteria bacterium]